MNPGVGEREGCIHIYPSPTASQGKAGMQAWLRIGNIQRKIPLIQTNPGQLHVYVSSYSQNGLLY